MNRLNPIAQKITSISETEQKNSIVNVIIKIAASLIIIGVFGYTLYYVNKPVNNNNEETTLISEKIIKLNERGRKSKIFLNDGSIIYLNSESKISYPSVFSDSLRLVELDGEAFFEVIKDEKRPFVVKTKNVDIMVLGTSFNVHTINNQNDVRIALVSGQVELMAKNVHPDNEERMILSPQQVISYNKNRGFIKPVSSFNALEEYGWKDGVIYFKGADLNEVIERLESWYNVDITIKNKPSFSWSYNGIFKDQSLQIILESMGYSQGFDFTIKDKNVEINFK